MITAAQFSNERACLAFSDYLSTQNITHQVITENYYFKVIVAESDSDFVQHEFQQFIANPNDPKYLEASWLNNKTFNKPSSLGLNKIWLSTGWLTKLVTVVCIAIYLASIAGYFEALFNSLHFQFSADEPYRLITPALMHLGALHIVFNLTWWWYLAGKVEQHIGTISLLVITLITAITSNIGQAVLENSNFAGLSGVTFGLAGFVWTFGRKTNHPMVQLPNNIFAFLVFWMILGFMQLLPISMANWAHLFGLISGVILAQVLSNRKALK